MPTAQLDTMGKRIGWARRQLAARENVDIPTAELARRMDVPDSTVTRWENDERLPNRANLFKLAGVLGVDVHWLNTGRDTDTPARKAGIPKRKTKRADPRRRDEDVG